MLEGMRSSLSLSYSRSSSPVMVFPCADCSSIDPYDNGNKDNDIPVDGPMKDTTKDADVDADGTTACNTSFEELTSCSEDEEDSDSSEILLEGDLQNMRISDAIAGNNTNKSTTTISESIEGGSQGDKVCGVECVFQPIVGTLLDDTNIDARTEYDYSKYSSKSKHQNDSKSTSSTIASSKLQLTAFKDASSATVNTPKRTGCHARTANDANTTVPTATITPERSGFTPQITPSQSSGIKSESQSHRDKTPNSDSTNRMTMMTGAIPSPSHISRLTRRRHNPLPKGCNTSNSNRTAPRNPSSLSATNYKNDGIYDGDDSDAETVVISNRSISNPTSNSLSSIENTEAFFPPPSPTVVNTNATSSSSTKAISTTEPVSPSQKNMEQYNNPVFNLLTEEMNLSLTNSAPFALPNDSTSSITSSPSRKNASKKKKGVFRKTSSKLKNILKTTSHLPSPSSRSTGRPNSSPAGSSSSSSVLSSVQTFSTTDAEATPMMFSRSASETWLRHSHHHRNHSGMSSVSSTIAEIGTNAPETSSTDPNGMDDSTTATARKVLTQDAQEHILMGSPSKLMDVSSSPKKSKKRSLMRSSSFSHRRRRNNSTSTTILGLEAYSKKINQDGGNSSSNSTATTGYSPNRKKANVLSKIRNKRNANDSSNTDVNQTDSPHSTTKTTTNSKNSMEDLAIKGRLDGMDVLSLGAARKISYITPEQKRFAGQRYTPRSMVTDMIASSCGQDYPELVLEGLIGSGDGRWMVSTSQMQNSDGYSCVSAAPDGSSEGVDVTIEHWDRQLLHAAQKDDNENDNEVDDMTNCTARFSNHCGDITITESEQNQSSSSKELPSSILLAQIWGKDNRPPPSHSTQCHYIEDDDDESSNLGSFICCPVDLDEEIFVFENYEQLQNVHDAAVAPLKVGKVDKAIEMFEKILRSIKSKCNRHVKTKHLLGSVFHNIGILQMWGGRYEDALESLSYAIGVRKQVLNHKSCLAVSYAKIGLVYFALEQFDKAQEAFENAIEIRKQLANYDHLELAKLSNNIGVVQYQKGNCADALKHFTVALQIQRKWTAKRIRRQSLVYETAVTLSNVGKVYLELDDYDMAFYVFEEALMLQTTSFSKDHDVILTSLGNIAFAKAKRGEKSNALEIYQSISRSQTSKYGIESGEVAETMGLMSVIHIQQCNYKAAKSCLENVLRWQMSNLDEYHPAIANTENMIGRLIQAMNGEVFLHGL